MSRIRRRRSRDGVQRSTFLRAVDDNYDPDDYLSVEEVEQERARKMAYHARSSRPVEPEVDPLPIHFCSTPGCLREVAAYVRANDYNRPGEECYIVLPCGHVEWSVPEDLPELGDADTDG